MKSAIRFDDGTVRAMGELLHTTPGVHLTGTDNADTIHGTSGADLIEGMGGGDTLFGGAGDDILDSDEGGSLSRIGIERGFSHRYSTDLGGARCSN